MKTRIKTARESAGYTQMAFAKAINVSRSYISYIECGERVPSDRTIADIARVCNVNEAWLRTGEGPMRDEGPPDSHYDVDSALNEIASELDLSPIELNLVKAYLSLPLAQRKAFETMFKTTSERISASEREEHKKSSMHLDNRTEKEVMTEEFERQFDLEKEPKEKSKDSMYGS